jgi:FkbM family methyltransferase
MARIYRRLPLRRQVLELMRALGAPKALRLFYFDGPFTIALDAQNRFRLCQHNHYGIETEIFWNGIDQAWEHRSLAAWKVLCQDAEVIFDIGAAEGIYALAAKCLRPGAKVVAIEPFPPRQKDLRRNVEANGYDIVCLDLAVSNFTGQADFFSDDQRSIMGRLEAPFELWRNPTREVVRVTTLAAIARGQGLSRIDLIKLDVEGGEAAALEGLGALLQTARPAMLVEILDDAAGAQVEAIVDGLGYLYFDIDDRPAAGPRALVRKPHLGKGAHLNWLLVSEAQSRRLAGMIA